MADDVIDRILLKYWKHKEFRPLQKEIIGNVLLGQDTLAILPTGGGKSVCFQVPAIAMEGLCIVITPLIALMKDQVVQLISKGIPAAAIHSGMHFKEVDITLENAAKGKYKFLYVSPERLKTELFLERSKRMKIALIAVDEAHCISQWGYDFRPPYLQIADFRKTVPQVPIIALTASATPEVKQDILKRLEFKNEKVFQKSFTRENLSYSVFLEENKDQKLLSILERVNGSSVVYVRNRKRTKEIAEFLKKNNISADYYHAGLEHSDRTERQDAWINNIKRVIVATNAFGMGIDKPNVRTVVHLDIPDSPEGYYQEAGRAGRDGDLAYAILIYNKADIDNLKENLEVSFPDVGFIRKVYQCLANFYKLAVGSAFMASFDFDLELFTQTYQLDYRLTYFAIKKLESEGFIQLNEAFFAPSKVFITIDPAHLYEFQVANPGLDKLLKTLLRTYGGELYSNFISISEKQIGRNIEAHYTKVIDGLERMVKLGVIIYDKQKEMPQIVFVTPRQDAGKMAFNLALYEKLKNNAKHKVTTMINYVSSSSCRNVFLLNYFGEEAEANCGKCDVCIKNKKEDEAKDILSYKNEVLELLKSGTKTYEYLLSHISHKRSKDLNQTLRSLQDADEIDQSNDGFFIKK